MARRIPRHEIFARAYVKELNGTRAAIAAGYAKKSARITASRLLTNANISALIASLAKKHADKLDLDAEKVLTELSRMGFSNILDYVQITKEGDAVIDLSSLTQEQAAAIHEITVDEYMKGKGKDARKIKRTKFKLADKIRALELLGKYLKLFTEKMALSGPDDGPPKLKVTIWDVSKGPPKEIMEPQSAGLTPTSP